MARTRKLARRISYTYIPKINESTISKTSKPNRLYKINEDLLVCSTSKDFEGCIYGGYKGPPENSYLIDS
jgi:hypothetical protein